RADADRATNAAIVSANGGPPVQIEAGTCHVFFAYDIGFAIDLDHAARLITAQTQRATIRHKRRAPPSLQYQPLPLRITQSDMRLSVGALEVNPSVDVVLYDFGAASVAYSVPLRGPFADLLPLSEGLYDNAVLLTDSRRRVEQLLTTIRPAVTDAD